MCDKNSFAELKKLISFLGRQREFVWGFCSVKKGFQNGLSVNFLSQKWTKWANC